MRPMPMWQRVAAFSFVTLWPSKVISPWVGIIRPISALNMVVLPQPLGPMTP